MTELQSAPCLAVVVPCFNENEVIAETAGRLRNVVDGLVARGKLSPNSRIVFVDDGSSDSTWEAIMELSLRYPTIQGLKLSRNYGHQRALLAGLLTVEGDAVISIDADLQDDVGAIEPMLDAFLRGNQVVYGVRKSRLLDSFLKRFTATNFYRVLKFLGAEIVFNHGDYRLLGRQAIETLREFNEVNLFLRGLVPLLGFRSTIVEYDRAVRYAGLSKYPLGKMLAFAWEGVSSLSIVPLRLITAMGMMVSVGSIGLAGWALGLRLFTDSTIPGWTSTVLPIYFLGGVQLLAIGVIGEYIGKIYSEAKHRPRYIIEESVGFRATSVETQAK